ncbi:MAG: heavy metal translocating P-type ATPase [Eggerthellaceae bacterium]|nr:heavy metal translocating P-type ATPase [Eggerthellaceae bacterium]
MLYSIVQDIPGRLRLRCGRGLIDGAQAAGITDVLSAQKGIERVRVAPANGSVLVVYASGNSQVRDFVLDYMDKASILALPEGEPNSENFMVDENSAFYCSIVRMAAKRAMIRWLIPPQLGAAYTLASAIPFVFRGLKALLRGHFTVDVLDATAVTVSLIQRNFTSAGSIMFMLTLSDRLQEHVNARTRIALQESLLTRAEKVWMVGKDGIDIEVQLSDLEIGDKIHVRTGQTIPIDGTVVQGDATVNEASMTGESAPVHKKKDSTVFAGTICEEGALVVQVDALVGSSRIDQIVHMVEESSELKAGVQAHAEQLADALVPGSLLAFAGVLAATRNLYTASSVLMVDFSCAIKLSTPVAVMSAMREASTHGAIIKGGKYLEALANADVIVFDKTGTLTTATPQVERILTFGKMNEKEVLKLAACLEEHFPHSLARSIVQAAKDAGVHHEDENHSEVEYIVAHGIASRVGRKKVYLGSAHFVFGDEGIPKPEGLDELLDAEVPRASCVFMAVGKKLEAVLCIADPLRLEAASVLSRLREVGISHQVMLTGDSVNCAKSVADELGIDDYHAQVLPEDKSRYIEELKAAGHTVIMVGDGINDSPALAAANVSVALNDASDIARAVADVSVTESSLESLLMLREISSKLMTRIHRDYRFIVGFNTTLIGGGILGFIPPTTAAFLHNASTVAITAANTRRLLETTA